MRVSKPAALAALGLALLAGCSKGGGAANTTMAQAGAGGGAGTLASVPQGGADVAISSADLPRLKAGYWESTTTTNGEGPEVHRFCSSGKPISAPSQMGRTCSTFSFKRTVLGGIVMDADCAEGPLASKMHMTASGDFNSSYTTDSQVSMAMQGKPASSFTAHSITRWIGPCPAGATPDD